MNRESSNTQDLSIYHALLFIWDYRNVISICTILGAMIGLGYSFIVPSIFVAQASISPKIQNQNGNASLIGRLGGFGDMVASQLGSGSANADRLEILLDGRPLAKFVLERKGMLESIYPDIWESNGEEWKLRPGKKVADTESGIEKITGEMIETTLNTQKQTILIKIMSHSRQVSLSLMQVYLEELNSYLHRKVNDEAKLNRDFLETQLNQSFDPLVREKIQQLIGSEIEKTMLISSKAFDILDPPFAPKSRWKPRRSQLLMLGALGGGFTGLIIPFLLIQFSALRAFRRKFHEA